MCEFKSGIILKNRVVLAPTYNDSHSRLLEKMKIEDNHFNAGKMFIRAELIPRNKDLTSDVKSWRYKVDQDIVPDWYEADPERYEIEFRNKVEDWMKTNTVIMGGESWSPLKSENGCTYYLLNRILEDSEFGKTNNYGESGIRKYLSECDLLKKLKEEFGNRLMPITTNLRSLDGLNDYDTIEGDLLAIPNLDLYRECREKIINTDWWWLSTPNSTPSGCDSVYVRYVLSDGNVFCYWCGNVLGCAPVLGWKTN